MKYCCKGLENLRENQLSAGFSIDVKNTKDGPVFWLYFRSVKNENVPKFKGYSLPEKFILAESMPIHRCPWCGVRLSRFYRKSWEQLASGHAESEFYPSEEATT